MPPAGGARRRERARRLTLAGRSQKLAPPGAAGRSGGSGLPLDSKQRSGPSGRARIGGLARVRVGLLLVLGLLVAAPMAGAQGERPKLLLLPIQVHSAEDPEYLRSGLADMLSARFARIGALELLRVDDPDKGTSSLERALRLGREAGADYVLYGSFTRFGQGASLDVQCAPTDESKARAPLREIFVHSGSIGEIIPDLDELAGKVSRFARGEVVSPAALAAAGGAEGLAPASASGQDLEEILGRIEALEAAVTELLETDVTEEDIEAATE